MKKIKFVLVLFSIMIIFISCNNHKVYKESFLEYRVREANGIIMKHEIESIKIIDTVDIKKIFKEEWSDIQKTLEFLKSSYDINDLLNQENEIRGYDYYSFAAENKGESEWIDQYLSMHDKLNDINNGKEISTADVIYTYLWFINRKRKYYGLDEFLYMSKEKIEKIDSIYTNLNEKYYQSVISYSFINPMFNNTNIKSVDTIYFDINNKCIGENIKYEILNK